MRKNGIRRLMSLLCVGIGVFLLAYPLLSNQLLERESKAEINNYEQQVLEQEQVSIQQELERARAYNKHPDLAEYESILWCDDLGMMGYLTIPSIDLRLPIYHGSSGKVLEIGIGHLPDSDFPVGETGTHAVLAGHTGLQGARLFTDLPKVEVGDSFYITVLGQTRAYQVVKVQVVLPEKTEELQAKADKELLTMVTCTPYGVNSHRLLVTGSFTGLVDTEEMLDAGEQTKNQYASLWVSKYRQALILAALIMSGFAVGIWLFRHRKVK